MIRIFIAEAYFSTCYFVIFNSDKKYWLLTKFPTFETSQSWIGGLQESKYPDNPYILVTWDTSHSFISLFEITMQMNQFMQNGSDALMWAKILKWKSYNNEFHTTRYLPISVYINWISVTILCYLQSQLISIVERLQRRHLSRHASGCRWYWNVHGNQRKD